MQRQPADQREHEDHDASNPDAAAGARQHMRKTAAGRAFGRIGTAGPALGETADAVGLAVRTDVFHAWSSAMVRPTTMTTMARSISKRAMQNITATGT